MLIRSSLLCYGNMYRHQRDEHQSWAGASLPHVPHSLRGESLARGVVLLAAQLSWVVDGVMLRCVLLFHLIGLRVAPAVDRPAERVAMVT